MDEPARESQDQNGEAGHYVHGLWNDAANASKGKRRIGETKRIFSLEDTEVQDQEGVQRAALARSH